jgi:hypothetical protein
MSRLVKIANWSGAPRASVVFVHGLGGHAYDTWRRKPGNDTFWPLWLAQDVKGVAVYTLAYEAPPSNWLGHRDVAAGPRRQYSRSLAERAGS